MTKILVTVTALDGASDETKETVSVNGPQFQRDLEKELFASVRTGWFGPLPMSEVYVENVPGQTEPHPDYQHPDGKFKTQ